MPTEEGQRTRTTVGEWVSWRRIYRQHPDDFVLALLERFPHLVVEAARNHRASLKNPPETPEEYLAELDAQGLSRSMLALRQLVDGRSPIL